MAKIFNKMLNFVGWDAEEEEEEEELLDCDIEREEEQKPQFMQTPLRKQQQQNKVVNIHSQAQIKMVIMQPENMDDAQDICDHLKVKKPVIINLEELDKDTAQRIIDFLSGSIYALEGNIQKVSAGIFVIAPNNVDIMGDFKEELRNKGVFPWAK
jgi:cell division inhibitor SepF